MLVLFLDHCQLLSLSLHNSESCLSPNNHFLLNLHSDLIPHYIPWQVMCYIGQQQKLDLRLEACQVEPRFVVLGCSESPLLTWQSGTFQSGVFLYLAGGEEQSLYTSAWCHPYTFKNCFHSLFCTFFFKTVSSLRIGNHLICFTM